MKNSIIYNIGIASRDPQCSGNSGIIYKKYSSEYEYNGEKTDLFPKTIKVKSKQHERLLSKVQLYFVLSKRYHMKLC